MYILYTILGSGGPQTNCAKLRSWNESVYCNALHYIENPKYYPRAQDITENI